MSEIYEALLRAEMERIEKLKRAGAPGNAVVPSAADPALLGALQSMGIEPARHSGETVARQRSAPAAVPAAGEGESPFRVRTVAWQPQVDQLPALGVRGALVEQIRVLRSRLHELRQDRPLKTVLITSGMPSEGKSFIASNLAVGFARFRNRRVLLIDGDMRRGRLNDILGAPQTPGLTDYLSNQASAEEIMQRMDPSDPGAVSSLASLTFIASGKDAENAADLSGNGRFEALLRTVQSHFDWIIIDSSPVTLVADGVNLGRTCDGVVLVTRAGVTKYEVAQRARHELKAAKLVGVVMNAVTEGSASVGGYYGYEG